MLRRRQALTLDEIDQLEAEWSALDARCVNPLGTFSWVRAALQAFEDDARPWIMAVSAGDRLRALAPLATARVRGVRRLLLAGVGQLHEPADLIADDQRALERLTRWIARSGKPLWLERMPADSPALALLKQNYRGRALVVVRTQSSCPYIELDDSWMEPESHLNAGRRSDLRRARRKAEQLGAVATEIHTPNLRELPALIDTVLDIEARSWKGASGTALAHDPHRAAFFRRYAEAACVDGVLRICFLRIGDRLAATQLAIEQAGGFWLLKVGYDQEVGGCSPGLLLMRETIRYAVEAGLRSYEFLGSAESWTRVWTSTERPCVSMRVYPLGWQGLAALTVDAAATLRQKWRKPS